MRIDCHSVLQALSGVDEYAQLVVPVYQRAYSWGPSQCAELWDDLKRVQVSYLKNPYGYIAHFFGSVVITHAPTPRGEHYVIDGQQRLLTVTLLIKAAIDYVSSSRRDQKILGREKTIDSLREDFLYKVLDDEPCRLRMRPNRNDLQCYLDVLLNKAQEQQSHFLENYQWFYQHMGELFEVDGFSLAGLKSCLTHFQVAQMRLESGDDAQRIFESINATGLHLTASDKVRNFVLMDLEPAMQKAMWEQYWRSIEMDTTEIDRAGISSMDAFLRMFLIMKLKHGVSNRNVYDTFKSWWLKRLADKPDGAAPLFQELAHFAHIYGMFVTHGEIPVSAAQRVLVRLKCLKILRVESIFLMSAYSYLDEHGQLDQLAPILETMESYTFRRMVLSLNTNGLTGLYTSLHERILAHMAATGETYLMVYQRELTGQLGRGTHFVNNGAFARGLQILDMYNFNYIKYFYAMLLNKKKMESEVFGSIFERIGDPKNGYTIEHVMPQKLSDEWQLELGPDWERIHQEYLHRLGNLTLSYYNPQLSNRSYREKKKILEESELSLNSYFKNVSQWGEKEILERGQELVAQAQKLWPYPELPSEETYSYDKDVPSNAIGNFAYTKIKAFTLLGQHFECTGWRWTSFQKEFMQQLLAHNPEALRRVAKQHKITSLSDTDSRSYSPLQIADGVWCETQLSADEHVRLARRCLQALHIPGEALTLHLHYENTSTPKSEELDTLLTSLNYDEDFEDDEQDEPLGDEAKPYDTK